MNRTWTIINRGVHITSFLPHDPGGPMVLVVPCPQQVTVEDTHFYFVLIIQNEGTQLIPSFMNATEIFQFLGISEELLPTLDEWEGGSLQ